MLHNLSNRSLFLKQGERLVTIEFHKLDDPATIEIVASKGVTSLKAALKENVVTSLQSLHKIVNHTKTRIDNFIGSRLAETIC